MPLLPYTDNINKLMYVIVGVGILNCWLLPYQTAGFNRKIC